MPFLRQDADNTLAETLGNLGGALGQSLNPMNQMRAQDMLAQMRQRQWELQHQQTLDAANRNAADVYERRNPFNEDPAALAVSAARIRNGQGDLNGSITALTAATTFKERQDAAALISARHPDWDAARVASAVADIGSGRKNLPEVESDVAGADLSTAKTGAAIGAGDAAAKAASAPGMDPYAAPLLKSAALQGQTGDVIKGINLQQSLAAGDTNADVNDPKTSALIQQENIHRAAGGVAQPAGEYPFAGMRPQKTAEDIAADVAKRSLGPGAPDQVIRGGTYDPVTRTLIPAAPAVPGQPPAAPAPGAAGTVSVGAAPPDTAASAATEGTKTQAHEVAMGDIKVLDEAISESGAAQAMKSKLAQLKDLTDALDTSGLGLTSRVLRTLADYNVHPGDVGATYGAIQQIINAEIPDVRQKAGIQRLAGPAIKEEQLILGTANMPKSTLMNIIANEEATADLQISRAMLAYRARTGQIPMNDYYKQSLALDATIKEHTDELRKAYKAIGTERTRPADVPPPNPNPKTDTTTNGGNPPALRFDKNTRSLVPVK